MGDPSEKIFKNAFKKLIGFKKRGYALDVISKPYRIKYVYDTETKSVIAEAHGNANLPEDKRLDDSAWETLKAKGYEPVENGNYIKLFDLGSKPVDVAYDDFISVFTDVFKMPTDRWVAYELSTTEPTPAITKLLNFAITAASEVSKQAYRQKNDPLARAGIAIVDVKNTKGKGCAILIGVFAGAAVAVTKAIHQLIDVL
ncbi:MAG: hypothetical protein ABIH86_00935 [Planctomycetota bacterium]